MARRVVILGAGGRDFHVFNTVFRDDPGQWVVAFTATQIPGIDGRRYPAELAGPHYPDGIPIVAEADLEQVVADYQVDEVVLAYSDIAHEDVMHLASRALAAGADFRLVGPKATMLRTPVPVVAVCATRTGAGKSQTSRKVAALLAGVGLKVALVRHPMPYGDLVAQRVQRFATLEELDAANPTLEEREEYEQPIRQGIVVWAGVDYGEILAGAAAEADVVLWDGGNNDFPFVDPDVLICVTDSLRPGHEVAYHPGEATLRMADVIVVNKVDPTRADDLEEHLERLHRVHDVPIVLAASRVALGPGPDVRGRRVLVVEDGPSTTHGGLPFGAGAVAATEAGAAELVDPRGAAVGSLAATLAAHPHLGPVLPAMGYSDEQLRDLAATIDAVDCDVVVTGTPVDLAHVVRVRHPIRHARYELSELGQPDLADVLVPHVERWLRGRRAPTWLQRRGQGHD
jgi:predicted GTPase